MNDLISVIVPVYNVETYLPECLDSILMQRGCELEIILIDDGSTDGSGMVCDAYARKDSRIWVIHQPNGGSAAAKNTGLRVAKGNWISFVDSDDYLEPGAYEYMLTCLRECNGDVIQCGFRNVYTNGQEDVVTLPDEKKFGAVEFLRRFTQDWTCGLLWDKLYRRDLFEGIFFEEGHRIDDEFFTYQGVMNAQKILHRPRIVYNYRRRRSSVMMSPDSASRILMDKLEYLTKRRVKVTAQFPALSQDFNYHYLSMLVILSQDAAATEESILRIKELLHAYHAEKNSCSMEFALRRKLFRLRYCSPRRLLRDKQNDRIVESSTRYFH